MALAGPPLLPAGLEDFGALAILAARDFDMPSSVSASSCSSFFTLTRAAIGWPFNIDFSAPALSQNRLGSNRWQPAPGRQQGVVHVAGANLGSTIHVSHVFRTPGRHYEYRSGVGRDSTD